MPVPRKPCATCVGHAIVAFPFKRGDLRPNDILMQVLYTDICHTDLHQPITIYLENDGRLEHAPACRPIVSADNQALRSDKDKGRVYLREVEIIRL